MVVFKETCHDRTDKDRVDLGVGCALRGLFCTWPYCSPPAGCPLLAGGEVLILIWETPSTEAAGPSRQLGAG